MIDQAAAPTVAATSVTLVFDALGRLAAASGEASRLLEPRGATTLEAIAAGLRSRDGRPVDLRSVPPDGLIAVRDDARVVEVSTQTVAAADAGRWLVVRIVTIDDDPSELVQRALRGVLAHELRTPLTTIYGGAQLVADATVPASARREAALAVAGQAQRLHDVVDDLVLLASSARLAEAEREPVLLQHVVADAVRSPDLRDAAGRVTTAMPPALPAVLALPDELEHALRNLIAACLAGGQGETAIAVRLADGEVELRIRSSVADGFGDRPFDLYGRPGDASDPSGVNLGPFVARRLVEAMGGRVWHRAVGRVVELGIALEVAPRTDAV